MTDGGLETTLIFHQGIDLLEAAAFHLLKDHAGMNVLRGYFDGYAAMARRHTLGFVLESPTWRANRDSGARVAVGRCGTDERHVEAICRQSGRKAVV